MPSKKSLTALVALGLGGVAAAAIPAGAAVGQSSPPATPIILRSTGVILDRGVVVNLSALVACPPGYYGGFNISLAERSGKAVVNGSQFVNVNCSGFIQPITVSIVGYNAPFVPGTAFVSATSYYDGTTVSRSVKLVAKK